jgi:pyruvate formate lyase activating enzyme
MSYRLTEIERRNIGPGAVKSGSYPMQATTGAKQSEQDIKGMVFDIKKYAIHDGPGIRTTVFLKGCPLRCLWCHNPESIRRQPEHGLRSSRCTRCGACIEVCPYQAISFIDNLPLIDTGKCQLCGRCVDVCLAGAREIIGRQRSVRDVINEIEKDVIFYDQSDGGVTFSGGEPLMQPEFLFALLNQCKKRRIHTAIDTSCYSELEILEKISEKTDLFLCDIKHMDNDAHEQLTGVENFLILNNIKHLSETGKKIILRIPVIPGYNDNDENIEATGEFAASLKGISRIDILPYNRGGQEKAARLTTRIEPFYAETPDEDKMNSIAEILQRYGFEVKIGG